MNNYGHVKVYPEIFGREPGSIMANNMERIIGDCGYAFNGTRTWPNCTGHYHCTPSSPL